jgi:hypothetical protein
VKLDYVATTVPFPLSAGASKAEIHVIASNPSLDPDGNAVALQAVAIFVPVGDGAEDVTADATGIAPVLPSGDWKLQPNTAAGEFVFVSAAASGVQVGADSVVFKLQNVQVNDAAGPAAGYVDASGRLVGFGVEEQTGDCKQCPSAPLSLTKFPADWGTVDFWVDDPVIDAGQGTNLNWSTQPPDTKATYAIEYADGGTVVNVPGPGRPALGSSGKYAVDPQSTTTYTLTVTLTDGTASYAAQDQKTVTVIELPKITSFTGTLSTTPHGYQVTYDWTANADNCALSSDSIERDPNPPDPLTVPIDAPGEWAIQLRARRAGVTQVDTSTLVVEWEGTFTGLPQPWSPVLSDDETMLYVLSAPPGDNPTRSLVGLSVAASPDDQLTQQFSFPSGSTGSIARAPGFGLWIVSNDGLDLVAMSPNGPISSVHAPAPVGVNASQVATSPDGKVVYLLSFPSGTNQITAWAPSSDGTWRELWSREFTGDQISSMIAGPDETLYVAFGPGATSSGYGIYAFDVSTSPGVGNEAKIFPMPWPFGVVGGGMAVSGDYLVSAGAGSIFFVDRKSGQVVYGPGTTLPIRSDSNSVTVASDGMRLFAPASGQGNIGVYSPQATLSGGTPPPVSVSGP